MDSKTNQIFDKIFKRILTLSTMSVIRFINSMFQKDFPINSQILYEWTENIDNNLNRTLADSIITINKTNQFHIEIQISNDETMVFRIFDYGYQHALKYKTVKDEGLTLKFPTPKIIFLEHTINTPDEIVLKLDFAEQGFFDYIVPTMKFLNYSINELNEQNMVILLPLYLLKLRKEVKKDASKENALAVKKLMNEGIIKSIIENEKNKNITHDDSFVLLGLLDKLYKYLYGDIENFKNEGVDYMLNERLVLDYEVKLEEELKIKVEEKLEEERKKIIILAEIKAEKEKIQLAKDMAKAMLESGMSIENVSKITKLPIDELSTL